MGHPVPVSPDCGYAHIVQIFTQNAQIWVTLALIRIGPRPTQIGGYTCVCFTHANYAL